MRGIKVFVPVVRIFVLSNNFAQDRTTTYEREYHALNWIESHLRHRSVVATMTLLYKLTLSGNRLVFQEVNDTAKQHMHILPPEFWANELTLCNRLDIAQNMDNATAQWVYGLPEIGTYKNAKAKK